MHRWIKRYKEEGEQGLSDKSRRPKTLANTKVTEKLEQQVLGLRDKKHWGAARISVHLLRKQIHLSPMTVWRILSKHQAKPIVKRRRKPDYKRYSKDVPGERVRLDVTRITTKAYQFTAIDDCTKMKTIRIYPNKKAVNSIHFLGELLDTFGFPVQRIQTDWGTEFFNEAFQHQLHEHFIKYRPIKPRSPDPMDLNALALEWQEFYNRKRPHPSLHGKTPYEKLMEVEHLISIQPDVTARFRESNECIFPRNYGYFNLTRHKKSTFPSKSKGK